MQIGHAAIDRAKSLLSESGQAVFEFALVFPLFIGLLMLLFDFGILMYSYVSVANATREGARYAAVNCNDGTCTAADVRLRIIERGGGIVKANPAPVCAGSAPFGEPVSDADPDMICVNWVDPSSGLARGGATPKSGDAVVVTVKHRYGFLLLPADFPVVSCAVMRLESDEEAASGGAGPISC